jgi:hypothetical protein
VYKSKTRRLGGVYKSKTRRLGRVYKSKTRRLGRVYKSKTKMLCKAVGAMTTTYQSCKKKIIDYIKLLNHLGPALSALISGDCDNKWLGGGGCGWASGRPQTAEQRSADMVKPPQLESK